MPQQEPQPELQAQPLASPLARVTSGSREVPQKPKPDTWRSKLRRVPALGPCFRCTVFLAGLVPVVAGLVLWMFSTILTLPALFLGLWIWSKEFHWGHRLFCAFVRYGESLLGRARRRPVTWSALSVGGVAAGGAAYWAAQHYAVVEKVTHALGMG